MPSPGLVIERLAQMAKRARQASIDDSELKVMLGTTFRMTGAPGTAPMLPRFLLPQLIKDYQAGRASPLMIVQADARAVWAHHWHLRNGGADPILGIRHLTLEVLSRMAKDIEPMTSAITADRRRAQVANTFGARLRAARKKAGLTQAQLAQKAGIPSVSTVRDWEAGRHEPQEVRIPRLLRVLSCSRSDLFGP